MPKRRRRFKNTLITPRNSQKRLPRQIKNSVSGFKGFLKKYLIFLRPKGKNGKLIFKNRDFKINKQKRL